MKMCKDTRALRICPITVDVQSRHCHRQRHFGFTLVETLIVVLIVAIVAALAVPRLGNTGMTRLKASADTLAADLGYAQMESIGHAASLRVVVFSPTTSTYHIAAATDPVTPVTNPVSKGPYRVTFGQGTAHALHGVGFSAVDVGGDNQLRFGVYGQLDQATAATITLAAGDDRLMVTVYPVTGAVVISDPAP